MAGKGGGAWKVAYADFVTAMMAFFLVMWITSQGKPVKQAVAQYFSDPWGNSATPSSQSGVIRREGSGAAPVVGPHKGGLGRGRGSMKPSPNAQDTADKGMQSGRPSLLVLQEKGHSHVGAVLQFEEHSAALDETATRHLEELVPIMLGKPNKIEIRGHASKRPLPKDSRFKNAWEISYARCLAAMNFLISKGVAPDRIRLSQAGPYEPQSSELQADWPALNSRVDVYMLGEFVDDFVGTHDSRASKDTQPASSDH